MNRKQFIKLTSLSVLAVSCTGRLRSANNGTFTGDCETTNDILGPFYRKGAPNRFDIRENKSGKELTLSGTIFSEDCTTPLSNILIEIWQADFNGEYDNDSKEYRYRGTQYSDMNGGYTFKTIIPGKYKNGELYRPSHIHFRVSGDGIQEIISQIYFQGDEDIDKDPWASKPTAKSRILGKTTLDNNKETISFDIYTKPI